ncbi:protein TRM32-like isoform X1 [Arachis stenosperma]|uniref:protein TRM32-like isoform X1 n=1 Tax=Arachis stenosperma TaxID=217475 RepID=UPI0025AD53E9|nr:protein TRM32-like isoform X1 [Arachis stenosperma]XP_057731869.1 protein TRM32-like isoform X1 [Arachis stenosperma]
MVKQLVSTENSSLEFNQDKNNQGCMWGFFHILDYHHWHVRKVFANKRKRHARCKRNTILHNQGEEYVPEAETLLVVKGGEKGKRYHKHERKEQDTENRLKEGNYKGEYALHVEKDGKKTKASLNHESIQKRPNKSDTDTANVFKNHRDVLGVVKVEKDLLLKFLRELDAEGKNLHQASDNKARLTKSGSFPLSSSSQMRSITPTSTLQHKKTEVWATPKEERLLDSTQTTKPVPLVSDHGVLSAGEQKTGNSLRPSHGLNHKGWNQVVIHRFKVIKHKIKHTLLEFRKNGHHRDSSEYSSITNDEKEVQSLDEGVVREYIRSKSLKETKSSDYASNRQEAQRVVRRTSSLNESMDKYTQLFEKSFNSDVKWHSSKSKSLRLTNEDKNTSDHASRFSRSNFSLPNIEALGFIVHEALLDMNDKTDTEEPDNNAERKLVELPSKKDKSIDHVEETEITETAKAGSGDMNPSPLSNDQVEDKIDEAVTSEKVEDKFEHESARGDGIFRQEKEEIGVAIHETKSEADETHHTEGRELDIQGSSMDGLKTDELPITESIYSSPSSLSNANDNTENVTNKSPEKIFLDTGNDSNFRYVKAILQFSGLMENEQILTRHTIDQRLKPSLIMEMESSVEENTKAYDQQLLFNLVDEVLLDIYERSSNHFPRPFAFNYLLHPVPKGDYLLNEVWSSVKSYLSLRPELDQTLDDVVRRDLARRSSWMNLQQEEEQVAIELEDMIMDDLLDELVFS